jgi:hypothetical protein
MFWNDRCLRGGWLAANGKKANSRDEKDEIAGLWNRVSISFRGNNLLQKKRFPSFTPSLSARPNIAINRFEEKI